MYNRNRIVDLLIMAGTDLNSRNHEDGTALMLGKILY